MAKIMWWGWLCSSFLIEIFENESQLQQRQSALNQAPSSTTPQHNTHTCTNATVAEGIHRERGIVRGVVLACKREGVLPNIRPKLNYLPGAGLHLILVAQPLGDESQTG
jgi:hypothetical protein